MTALPQRDQVMAMEAEAIVAGARQERAFDVYLKRKANSRRFTDK